MRILYLNPDYHSSFFEKHELEMRGHFVSIFVQTGYPVEVLFSKTNICGLSFKTKIAFRKLIMAIKMNKFKILPNCIKSLCLTLTTGIGRVLDHVQLRSLIKKHDLVYIYGNIDALSPLARINLNNLRLCERQKKRIYLKPSGCRDEALKEFWRSLDSGSVCGNCGIFDSCDDSLNLKRLNLANKFVSGVSSSGFLMSGIQNRHVFPNKMIDLNLWSNVDQTIKYSNVIKIYHSFAANGRETQGKNIKGSPIILQVIEELKLEGFQLEILNPKTIPSREIIFFQKEADIVVDQLHYGWWGSNALECAALGKPVMCYMRESFLLDFYLSFPSLKGRVPFVNINPLNLKDELRKLIVDKDLRLELGVKSREFAKVWLDPQKNVELLENFLQSEKRL